MKAAVLEEWKSLAVRQVRDPEPSAGEALIKVGYTGICGSDAHIFNGDIPIARTPVIPGHEFMGTIAAIEGQAEEGLAPGRRVAVHPLVSCGVCVACRRGHPHVCEKLVVIGVNRDGAFAEYVSVPAERLIPLGDDLPDEVAALTEPFAVGFHACKRADLKPGERVLVIGGGPIGLFAAMVARRQGAVDIAITEPMAARRAFVESHGFAAFDPINDACLSKLAAQSAGEGFDVVIETSGVDAGLRCAVEAASPRGRIVSLGFPAERFARYNVTFAIMKELSFIGSRVYPRQEFCETVQLLTEAVRDGEIAFDRLIMDVRGLEDLERSILGVAEGRERGKILIRPSN
ncbi:zinc-binding dehydrogenase [Pelagibius sp.]|uniref:zinc-dependent alcohol dehydrogenase n=1 Tax=Pelagibius sp. TaxID=1931238 RepID=UPI00261C7669|nr:alcohol dehydrogenase catalytic domain-containing protein [Pelagibius sp.]